MGRRCEGALLAEQRPKDVDRRRARAMTAWAVDEAFGAFLQVVVAVRSGAHHAGLRREVEDVPQRAAVAPRPVQVTGAPTGVVRDGTSRLRQRCGRH